MAICNHILQEIEEQFGPNWKVLPPIKFTLGTKVGTQKQEKIKVNFYRTIPECGWLLSLESDSKVPSFNIINIILLRVFIILVS